MTRPSLRVRVLGCPPVSFGLLAVYVFWPWYSDQIPFIVPPLAFLAAIKTVKAYAEKREFQEWQRRQREEGKDAGDAQASPIISRATVLCVLLALGAVYGAAVYQAYLPEGSIPANALQGVKWLALLYLGVALVRVILAWYRRKKKCEAVVPPAEPFFVSWMLEVPAESPSRADAERELPEYCAGLMEKQEPAHMDTSLAVISDTLGRGVDGNRRVG